MSEELKLLEEWQTLLGLNDWFIVLETGVSADNMDVDNADGCVVYQETVKAAKIQIIKEEDRLVTNEEEKIIVLRPFDFEVTLVHELLHLKFCLLERGDDWENKLQLRILHQIIDDLSRALVDAKRSNE